MLGLLLALVRVLGNVLTLIINAAGSDAVVLGSWYRASGYLVNIFEVNKFKFLFNVQS